jgi:hypothetical protein
MKKLLTLSIVLLFAAIGTTQATLLDPPLLNPSFESVENGGTPGDWGYSIDNWNENPNTNAVFYEKAAGIGLTGDGLLWAGCETGGELYQPIGAYSGDETFIITLLIGDRNGNSFGTGKVSLYAGAGTGADGTDLASFATLLSTADITKAKGTLVSTNVYEVQVALSTGTTATMDAPLWLEISSVSGKDYFDHVRIELSAKATDPVPGDGETGVALNPSLGWSAPSVYTSTQYKIYFDPNESLVTARDALTLVSTQTDTTPVAVTADLYDTPYYWCVDAYEPNMPNPILHKGDVWSFTTMVHPSTLEPGLYAPGISIGNASFEEALNYWIATPVWFDNGGAYQEPFPLMTYYGDMVGVVEQSGTHWQPIGTWTANTNYVISWGVTKRPSWADGGTKISLWSVAPASVPADQATGDATTPTAIGATKIAETAVHSSGVDNLMVEASETLNTGTAAAAGDTLLIQIVNGGGTGRGHFDMVRVNLPRADNIAWGGANDSIDPTQAITLTWHQGVVPANNYQPDPSISGYTIYFGTEPGALVSQGTKTVGSETLVIPALTLSGLTPYYWRVDETTAGGTVTGPTWSFTSGNLDPYFTDQPDSVTDSAGASVIFTVAAELMNGYNWMHNGVPVAGGYVSGTIVTNGDYVVDNSGDPKVCTLTIHNLVLADEGTVTCVISGSQSSATTESNPARLMTKRLVGWWKLDGDLTDSVDQAVAGTPTHDGTAIDPIFEPVAKDGGGIAFDGEPNAIVTIADSSDYFNFYPQGYAVSAWVNMPVKVNSPWGAYICKQGTSPTRGFILTHQGDGQAVHTLRQSFNDLGSNTDVDDNSWHLVVGTYDGATKQGKVYVDGVLKNQATSTGSPAGSPANLIFGAENLTATTAAYVGQLDDVRIWTYPLSPEAIAQLYVDFNPGVWVCVERPELDTTGPDGVPDCQVDVFELAQLAEAWLECGLSPSGYCF